MSAKASEYWIVTDKQFEEYETLREADVALAARKGSSATGRVIRCKRNPERAGYFFPLVRLLEHLLAEGFSKTNVTVACELLDGIRQRHPLLLAEESNGDQPLHNMPLLLADIECGEGDVIFPGDWRTWHWLLRPTF